MKEVSIKLYQYDELSEKAKEKAIQWYSESMDIDYQFAWEHIQEDAKNIGLKLNGIDRGYMKGDFIESARECANKILKEHGKDCATYKTASQFIKELEEGDKEYEETGSENRKYVVECEFRESLLEDYLVMSEKEEEYLNSKEHIEESIRANEYTFLENGNRFEA